MSEYQRKLEVCIDEKLITMCIEEGKSLLDTDIKFHYHIGEVARLFHRPQEHYSKILVIAYNKTIKDMRKADSLDYKV